MVSRLNRRMEFGLKMTTTVLQVVLFILSLGLSSSSLMFNREGLLQYKQR